jgi:hypothetical protein
MTPEDDRSPLGLAAVAFVVATVTTLVVGSALDGRPGFEEVTIATGVGLAMASVVYLKASPAFG